MDENELNWVLWDVEPKISPSLKTEFGAMGCRT